MPARAAMPGANRGQNARQSRKPERANRRQCPARTAMPRANRGQPPRQSRKPEHANRGQCPARTAMAGRAHPPYSQFRIPNSEFRIPNYPRRSPRAQTPVPGLNPAGTSITPAHNSPSYDNSPPPCRASADKRPGAAAGEYTALPARETQKGTPHSPKTQRLHPHACGGDFVCPMRTSATRANF